MTLNNCLFCNLQKNKELVLFETKLNYVIYDKYPAREGHLLVITKDHYRNFFETPLNVKMDMMIATEWAQQYLEKKYHPSGYRVQLNCEKDGMQEIFHTHLHLIPAYPNDPITVKKL